MRMIITADWHIRNTKPRCRLDENWNETQKKALKQIYEIATNKDADVYVVGDVFHSNTDTSFQNIQMVQELANNLGHLYILAGNHDLPYHSSENLNKSAIGVLFCTESVTKIPNTSEISASNFDEENENKEIIFKHILCFPDNKSIPPNVSAVTAAELLEQYNKARWIFIGDYHHSFHYEKNGRHVINPGCLLRQASDMKDYQCGVYYVDTEKEIIEFIPIHDDEELVNDDYIIRENERDERIESFVNKLKDVEFISLDFLDNVEKALLQNNISDDLKNCVKELMEI